MPAKKSKAKRSSRSKKRFIWLSKRNVGLLFILAFATVGAVKIFITYAADATTPVHQMYYTASNPIRIYTLNPAAFSGTYNDEGVVFHAYGQSQGNTVPIYQWHRDNVGYIYSQCASGCFTANGFVPDGVVFHAYNGAVNGAVAIHQQSNGQYFIYTACSTCFTSSGWVENGVAFYAFASAQTPPTPPPPPSPSPSPSPAPSPSPSPSPSPGPSPSPTPSPGPTPSPPGSTPSGGNIIVPQNKPSNPTIQGGGAPSAKPINVAPSGPDTTPPTTPANFSAQTDEQGVSIKLSWDAATDNSGSVNYHLERSPDQQDWKVISESTSDTSYADSDVKFATHYYYRINAADSAGNKSGFSLADATTAAFTGNASPDQDITLNDDYNHIQAKLPAGALADLASCSIESSSFKSIGTSVKGYIVVSGPFQILCKKADSSIITSFNKPVTVTWTLKPPKNVTGPLEYYGDETTQSKLTIVSHDAKSHTDSFTLDKGTTFAALGKAKHSSVLVKIFVILAIVVAIIGTVLGILYWRYRRQLQAQYDDYSHKSRGI